MTLNENRWQRKLAKKRKSRGGSKQVPCLTSGRTVASSVRLPGQLRIHESKPNSKDFEAVTIVSYEITEDPMPDEAFDRLPIEVQEKINSLRSEVLTAKPKRALAVLETLIKQYSDIAQLYNYLFIAHYNSGNRAEASRVLRETLQRFPDYLFAKISWAEECLNQGEANKVKDIFEGKLDLTLLYPKRVRFHITEVLGFQCVVARYYHAQGNLEQAQQVYELMRQLDPKHPGTRLAGRILYPSRVWVWLRNMVNRLRAGKSK